MAPLFSNFHKLAKFLRHPLVLIGYVLMLFFYVHGKLIDSGIIPPLSPDEGSVIVQLILTYGFQLSALVIILGFAWQFYKTRTDSDVKKKPTLNN